MSSIDFQSGEVPIQPLYESFQIANSLRDQCQHVTWPCGRLLGQAAPMFPTNGVIGSSL